MQKSEFGIIQKAGKRKVGKVVYERGIVDDLQIIRLCRMPDSRKHGSERVPRYNTDDERHKTHRLCSLYRTDHDDEEGDDPAQNRNQIIGIARSGSLHYVADSVPRKGKPDQRDGRPDNYGRKQFVYPRGTDEHNDKGDRNVYKPRNDRTHNNAPIPAGDRRGKRT